MKANSHDQRARKGQLGAARGALLGVVAFACLMGLAFMSGSLDGVLASLKNAGGGADTPSAEEPQPVERGQPSAATPSDEDDQSAARATGQSDQRYPGPFDWNEEAVDALDAMDFDRAIELLARAHEAAPENETYRANLSVAYVRRGRSWGADGIDEALEDFDNALAYVDDEERRAKIAGLRDRKQTIADEEADFSEESTLHFTFRFDASRTEIRAGVDRLQKLLEDTYQEYGELFGRRPVESGEPKIGVVLYRSEGFNNVTGLGDWAGGVFDGTIRVPADDLRDPRRVARLRNVLRHEVAHAFTQSIGGKGVPAWLNEGIAQWLENPERRSGAVAMARARLGNAKLKAGKELFPLESLTGTLSTWSDTQEITRAYDQALTFSHYLTEQYGSALIFDMVAACKAAGSEGAAAEFQRQIQLGLDVVLADFDATLR